MKEKGDNSNILWAVREEGRRNCGLAISMTLKLRGAFLKVMLEAQEKRPRMLQVGAQLGRLAQDFSQ